ncbi:MAG TPA: alpha-glucan family phosphorylase [Actinomycetota bacterium]|nr:alpha-glucan family phosphorylase [Actinomycetota bacterium]
MGHDGLRDLERAASDLAARLPEPLAPLARLAFNYRWSWAPKGRALFESLDGERFERCRGNPVRLLQQLPASLLQRAASDPWVLETAAELEAMVADELGAAAVTRGEVGPDRPVAFLCAEFGIHASLPVYSGGLGVLAGDILKEASDRRIPLVGVGILYSKGSFHQRLDPSGWQHDFWIDTEPDRLPAAVVTGDDGHPLILHVPLRNDVVRIQVWRVQIGRVPLFLLDANVPGNDVAERWITARLYVGDRRVRLEQYALLGLGGMSALEALGFDPAVVHLNEGHAAFAPVELARRAMAGGGRLEAAVADAKMRTVFTTHTPVPAGNEAYAADDVREVLGHVDDDLAEAVVTAGATGEEGQVGMTSLGLRLSRTATAVSELHGRVAREMWAPLYRSVTPENVPIGHVTNGVHVPTWMSAPMRDLLDRHLGDEWPFRAANRATWEPVDDIPAHELWAVRNRLRANLVAYVREADAAARLNRYEDGEAVQAAFEVFDPDRLTLGFARRVATYKRLSLLFRDPDRLSVLLDKPDTVQFVLAGKAHPRDDEAKASLAGVFRQPWPTSVAARIAFLEDYDLAMASRLVAGCDVWVNLPRPPMEASGTSGMKSALNGGINLSVLDGWWAEAFDGSNGWRVGDGPNGDEPEERDARDAEALFDVLEQEVLPRFHERDANGVPVAWVSMLRSSLKTAGTRFAGTRMVHDYLEAVWAP